MRMRLAGAGDAEQRQVRLRIVRSRLALVGGTLDIESGEAGTTLLVTLPTGGTE